MANCREVFPLVYNYVELRVSVSGDLHLRSEEHTYLKSIQRLIRIRSFQCSLDKHMWLCIVAVMGEDDILQSLTYPRCRCLLIELFVLKAFKEA